MYVGGWVCIYLTYNGIHMMRAVAFLAEVRLEMVKVYYGEETDKEKGR